MRLFGGGTAGVVCCAVMRPGAIRKMSSSMSWVNLMSSTRAWHGRPARGSRARCACHSALRFIHETTRNNPIAGPTQWRPCRPDPVATAPGTDLIPSFDREPILKTAHGDFKDSGLDHRAVG